MPWIYVIAGVVHHLPLECNFSVWPVWKNVQSGSDLKIHIRTNWKCFFSARCVLWMYVTNGVIGLNIITVIIMLLSQNPFKCYLTLKPLLSFSGLFTFPLLATPWIWRLLPVPWQMHICIYCVKKILSIVGKKKNISFKINFEVSLLGTCSKKKCGIIWEFFPTWGGSSQFPKLKTKKKVPLNHPKVTHKTN